VEFGASLVTALFYFKANRSENVNGWVIAASIALCVRHFGLISLSLFLVAGLSIVYVVLPWTTVVKCLGIALAFVLVEFLCDSEIVIRVFAWWIIIAFLLFIGIFMIYSAMIANLADAAVAVLDAHLVMCMSIGVVPETTPSERKKEMLAAMRKFARLTMAVMAMSLVFHQLISYVHFLAYIILAISTFLLHCNICWVCRLRKAMAATYGESAEDYAVPPEDAELRPWEYGMELPPMPIFVEGAPDQVHGAPMPKESV
jgi:hypothetical protein